MGREATTRGELGLVIAAVLGCVPCVTAAAQPRPAVAPAPPAANGAAQLKELLKQRHETFRELVEMLVAQYRAGVVDFGRVAAAQRDMLRAAAELEEDAQKRLDALRGVVEIATRVQQGTEDRHKAGIVGQADVLQAKAVLLEARIELLREELRSRRGK